MRNKDQILLESLYLKVLNESESLYSWMDPSGGIISNKGEGHFQASRKILQSKYNVDVKDMMFADQTYNFLFEKGWMRLTYLGKNLYCHNNKMRPNQKQLTELKNLAIENHMHNIYFDDEYSEDYRSIWSSNRN
jgi:hypothetical protein